MAEGDEPYVLSDVQGATLVGDDRVAIADGTSREVRLFTRAGEHVRTIGGRGGGPTEFQYLRLLQTRPIDSIFTADPMLRKVVVFDREGALARTSRLTPQLGAASPVGALELGAVFLASSGADLEEGLAGVHRPSLRVAVASWSGEPLWEIGHLFGAETARMGSMSGAIPFGRDLHVAVSGDRVVVGHDDAFRLRIYDADGQLLRIIAVDSPAVPVEAGDLDAWISEALAGQTDEGFRRRAMEAAREMPQRDTHPFFKDVTTGPANEVWVLRGGHPTIPNDTWAVFDSAGVMVSEATVAGRAELLHVAEQYVLLLRRDDTMVERVELHRLSREAGR